MHGFRSFLIFLICLVIANAAWAHGSKRKRGADVEQFQVTVTCDVQKAKSAGDYGWVHPAYKDAEPPPTKCTDGQKETLRFFQLSEDIVTVPDVIEAMARENCTPSEWPALMALGAQHPDSWAGRHVAAIGSVWTHHTKNPALNGLVQALVSTLYVDEDGRNLGFDNFTGGWNSAVTFVGTCPVDEDE